MSDARTTIHLDKEAAVRRVPAHAKIRVVADDLRPQLLYTSLDY
jgi:hypothetical protein